MATRLGLARSSLGRRCPRGEEFIDGRREGVLHISRVARKRKISDTWLHEWLHVSDHNVAFYESTRWLNCSQRL